MNDKLTAAAVRMAYHIHENRYEGLIVSGGSNRLTRSLITCPWVKLFKRERHPKIYIFDRSVNHLLYKSSVGLEQSSLWVDQWIKISLPELAQKKNSRLCLVDDFAMTGLKFNEVPKILANIGFSNLSLAVVAASTAAQLDSQVFVSAIDDELVIYLQELATHVQGFPDYQDLLARRLLTPAQFKKLALSNLKAFSHAITP